MTISTAIGAVNKLGAIALVTPFYEGYQPLGKNSTDDALLFHIEAENSFTLQSDITDHVVEDNTNLQDHIGLKPITITVRGFIGELNTSKSKALQIAQIAVDKLFLVQDFIPEITLTALRAYNLAEQAYRLAQNVNDQFIAQFDDSEIQNKQQKFADRLLKYWKDRTLFDVQTPWFKYTNMAIQNLTVIQEEDDPTKSDFQITFKEVKFAQTVVTGEDEESTGRAFYQRQEAVNTGYV